MNSPENLSLTESLRRIADSVVIDSDKLSDQEIKDIIELNGRPRFMSFMSYSYETKVKRLGNTHGIGITKEAAKIFHLKPGDYVELILMHPKGSEPLLTSPSKEELDKIHEKHDFHFRFEEGIALSDFNFTDLGRKYHIPIYNKLSIIGTSYAFFINIEVLDLFGFKVGDTVNLIIRKVDRNEKGNRR